MHTSVTDTQTDTQTTLRQDICEPNVGGWPWQILGAIRAVATV